MVSDNLYSPKINHNQFFENLVDQYGEALLRLAFSYVKNQQVAEDIVQDVFIRAFEKMDEFKGHSSYKTYLYRITINRSYDYLRSWSYKNVMLSHKLSMFFQSGHSTETEVLVKDENYRIGKEVYSLPVKYREIIFLYYYKDFSVEEIADLLNCSENTVKTRLRRGREKLRGKIEKVGGANE